ncbi:hypothetical protein [Streptomyces sp. NPDC102462]|uniref:hypothetical protein n=1 Tax=Streptomyces sp. NPDC102462 TaxID=3366178 RepID=UPI00380F724D
MSRSRTTREQAAPKLSAAELLELSEADGDGDAEPLESADLLARRMRELAVSHWLLTASDDREQARKQWADQGIALLACGGILSAVRIPAGLVWAAAGTENLEETDGFLRRFFDGGAVFMDLHARLYYVLVPGLTDWKWSDRDFPGVECLGTGHFPGRSGPVDRGAARTGLLVRAHGLPGWAHIRGRGEGSAQPRRGSPGGESSPVTAADASADPLVLLPPPGLASGKASWEVNIGAVRTHVGRRKPSA